MPVKKETSKAIETEITIMELNRVQMDFYLLGKTPFISHAVNSKVTDELLLPSLKKSASQKASTLKHDFYPEFLNSLYYARDSDFPTEFYMKGVAVKRAMAAVATDMSGVARAQIGRLVSVNDNEVPIYGIPTMFMTDVLIGGMNKTRDISIRALFPEWATKVTVEFTTPMLKEKAIANLL